jgi:cysteine-rich repeat protein
LSQRLLGSLFFLGSAAFFPADSHRRERAFLRQALCNSGSSMSFSRVFNCSLWFALSVVAVGTFTATVASAYDAQVGWNPVDGAAGYELHLRYDDEAPTPAVNLGQVSAESDGTVRVVVEDLPLGPTARFTVVAYADDGEKSDPSNEIVLSYADVAVVVDSDGDGLTDAEEDVDLDGVVDEGESDPGSSDTDGDGVSDADEVAAGTDPTGYCGNGVVDGSEDCDDANADQNDGCLADCRFAECVPGDGTCNDGNVCTSDACSQGRCVRTATTGSCDDGLGCSSSDICRDGICRGVDQCGEEALCSLATGECESLDVLAGLWIPAGTYPVSVFKGDMTAGVEYTAGTDADPASDSLTHLLLYPESANNSYDSGSGDEIVYKVNFPESGNWYMWGRFYYPGAGDDSNSFFVRVDNGEPQKFGNNSDFFKTWHWDGDGNRASGQRIPLDLGSIEGGIHTITVEKREAEGEPPRLDALFFTRDSGFVPDDTEARIGIDVCREKSCGGAAGTSLCGDATDNGVISIADAWLILNAAVSLGSECSFAVCDLDGNDSIDSSDARRALEAAVGVDVTMGCRPSLGFVINDAVQLDTIEFLVDYSTSGVEFSEGAAGPLCEPAMPGATAEMESEHDAESGLLSIRMSFDQPVSGSETIAECRFQSGEYGALPAPSRFGTDLVSYSSRARGAGDPQVATTVVVP